MTLETARAIVRQTARNAATSDNYSDADVDRAIQISGNDFMNATRCLDSTGTKAIIAAATTIDLSAVTGFRADRFKFAYIDVMFEVVDLGVILAKRESPAETGQPSMIAFVGTTGHIYPTSDDAYTINYVWNPPFTDFTAGTETATTLNTPDDLLMGVLRYGAVAELQQHEPEQQVWVGACRQNYEQHKQSVLNQQRAKPTAKSTTREAASF